MAAFGSRGRAALVAAFSLAAGALPLGTAAQAQTYSSPIALAPDGALLWVVNPDDDSVTIIDTATNEALDDRSRSATSRAASRSTRATATPSSPTPPAARSPCCGSSTRRPRTSRSSPTSGRPGRRADHRRRALERRGLARRPARLRRQQRPGHDHGDRRAGERRAGDPRPRRPAQQPLQRRRRQAPLPAVRPRGHRGQQPALHRAAAVVHLEHRRPGRRPGQGRRGLPARHRHPVRPLSPTTGPPSGSSSRRRSRASSSRASPRTPSPSPTSCRAS